jgi:hypothetical protein
MGAAVGVPSSVVLASPARRDGLRGGLDVSPPDQATGVHLAWVQQLARAKARLRARVCCSEAWVEAVTYRGEKYPPPADTPPGMPRCRGCGRNTPQNCIGSSGHCDDCRLAELSDAEWSKLPSSVSGIAFQTIRQFKIRLSERGDG